MDHGRVVYFGRIADLIDQAQGKVWTVTTAGPKPTGDYTVIATMRQGAATQYRVVGDGRPPSAQGEIAPAAPGLEEAYIWLMRDRRAEAAGAPGATVASGAR
jgi:hypothetical protein